LAENDSIDLLRRLELGDEYAAFELFDRFVVRLVSLARSRMSSRLQQRLDPDDVVQSALRSFFRRARRQEFTLVESGDLWRLLSAITVNKTRSRARHHTAGRRALEAEVGALCSPDELARDPTPEEACILLEELTLVIGRLSPLHRSIVELYAQNYSVAAVADRVKCTERSVYRALSKCEEAVRERLQTSTLDS